jgi:hypothetical protein
VSPPASARWVKTLPGDEIWVASWSTLSENSRGIRSASGSTGSGSAGDGVVIGIASPPPSLATCYGEVEKGVPTEGGMAVKPTPTKSAVVCYSSELLQ